VGIFCEHAGTNCCVVVLVRNSDRRFSFSQKLNLLNTITVTLFVTISGRSKRILVEK
jgi:hypothetical protein